MTIEEIKSLKTKIRQAYKNKYEEDKKQIFKDLKQQKVKLLEDLKNNLKEEKRQEISKLNKEIKHIKWKQYYDKTYKIERQGMTIRDTMATEMYGVLFKDLTVEQKKKLLSKYQMERRKITRLKKMEGEQQK